MRKGSSISLLERDTGSRSIINKGANNFAYRANSTIRDNVGAEAPSGLFIGTVMDDRDLQNMGRLWVYIPEFSNSASNIEPLVSGGVNSSEESSSWIRVSPVFPYFGSNDSRGDDNARSGLSNSYGFWAQPRIGDVVAVMFANNDASNGYWIGCVPKQGQTFMVPGTPVEQTFDEDFPMPASETVGSPGSRNTDWTLTDSLKNAGLQLDFIRGGSSSSAWREEPSLVFGIKTAGEPLLRQIGHSFVMDDDPSFQGIRLRTSKGGQVLISDVTETIYISTPGGATWIEVLSDGHVDVYAQNSVSVHAEKDINLTAGQDLNIDVGRDINTNVAGSIKQSITGDVDVTITGDYKDQVSGEFHSGAVGARYLTSSDQTHIQSTDVIRINSNDSVQTQNGATSATPPTEPGSATLPGAPTISQIGAASPGSNTSYVAGSDGNMRVPQHEPWDPDGDFRPQGGEEVNYDTYGEEAGLARFEIDSEAGPTERKKVLSPLDPNDVKNFIIHCAATRPSSGFTVADIDRWHKARRWAMIGYHKVIYRDGSVHDGRPLNRRGAHAYVSKNQNYNKDSIGICLMGGLSDDTGLPYPDYTTEQMTALTALLKQLAPMFPKATKILGHNNVTNKKACPSFDVPIWVSTGKIIARTGYRDTTGLEVPPHPYNPGSGDW